MFARLHHRATPEWLRALTALLIGSLALATLTACHAATQTAEPEDDRPLVLTTFTVLEDLAREVAGDRLRVESITKPGAEIHHYEPTPHDLAHAGEAALIVDNGLGLEAWFEQFVDGLNVPHATLSDGVEPMNIADGEAAGTVNPHAWMSPDNAKIYVDNLVDAFSDIDPEGHAAYQSNGENYKAQLDEVKHELVDGLAELPARHRMLVTCEGAFSYLARDAELDEAYLWPVNADGEGTPQQIAALSTKVAAAQVPAVFCESTVNDSAMRQLAEETGTTLAGTLYVDSLSEADGPVPSYLELLRYDVRTIVAGLSGKATR